MELLLNQVSIYGFTYCFGQVSSKVIIARKITSGLLYTVLEEASKKITKKIILIQKSYQTF